MQALSTLTPLASDSTLALPAPLCFRHLVHCAGGGGGGGLAQGLGGWLC